MERMRWYGLAGLLATAVVSGCALMDFASVKVMYQKASLPDSQIHKDIAYRESSTDPKQRLDLYVPERQNWPVLVFIHGGGWNTGDKAYDVAGSDLYANIGRYFASRGIGTAVINYRLLPHVNWREQIRDAAAATAWVYRNAARYGGNPKRLFLSGHSAGAQLAARIALDPEPLKKEGFSKGIVAGVIGVSGAGYEIASKRSISSTGGLKTYYAKRFADGDETDAWAKEASILRFIDKTAPPFLILYGSAETNDLKQQSELLAKRLKSSGVPMEWIVIPHRDHIQTVMTMSREEGVTTPALRHFIEKY